MFWALGSKFVSTRQPHVERHETKNLSRRGVIALQTGTSLFQAIDSMPFSGNHRIVPCCVLSEG